MDFAFSDKSMELQARIRDFMDDHVIPRHAQFKREEAEGRFHISFMDDLKALAQAEGLWNLFLPALQEDEPEEDFEDLIEPEKKEKKQMEKSQ